MGATTSTAVRDALVQAVASQAAWNFLVTASLHPGASRAAVEAALRSWCARIDRAYLGRNWQLLPKRRMQGVAFFETRPHHHAHLILQPPHGASNLNFLMNGASWFRPNLAPELRFIPPRPIASQGIMQIDRIGPSRLDREKVVKYVTKEFEFRPPAEADWKFLADLAGS